MPHVAFVDMKPYGLRILTLARTMGCDVTLVRSRVNRAGSAGAPELVDDLIEIDDPCAGTELTTALADLHRRHPVDGIVALHDEVVGAVASIAAELGIRFTDPVAVGRARDKALCRRTLAAAGLTPVEHLTLRSVTELAAAGDRLGYPFVVKPAAAAASIAAAIVPGPRQLETAAAKVRDALGRLAPEHLRAFGSTLLAERYLEGPLISAEVAVLDGRCTPLAVLERQRYEHDRTMELGSIAPARLSETALSSVTEYTNQVIDVLGLDIGVFHIEVIMTAAGPVLIDPNPRLVGGPNPLLVNHCWDVDVHAQLLAVHLGTEPAPVPVAPRRHGAAHVLVPTADGVRHADADLAWLDHVPGVVDWSLRVRPGEATRRARGNLDYVGHVLALADSCQQAAEICIGAVDRLADETGIPMIRWQPLTERAVV
jgi:biotin carboxylase